MVTSQTFAEHNSLCLNQPLELFSLSLSLCGVYRDPGIVNSPRLKFAFENRQCKPECFDHLFNCLFPMLASKSSHYIVSFCTMQRNLGEGKNQNQDLALGSHLGLPRGNGSSLHMISLLTSSKRPKKPILELQHKDGKQVFLCHEPPMYSVLLSFLSLSSEKQYQVVPIFLYCITPAD